MESPLAWPDPAEASASFLIVSGACVTNRGRSASLVQEHQNRFDCYLAAVAVAVEEMMVTAIDAASCVPEEVVALPPCYGYRAIPRCECSCTCNSLGVGKSQFPANPNSHLGYELAWLL